jgi:hypothetical protein
MKTKRRARQTVASQPPWQPPWRTDAQAAQESALAQGRPCVLILNADNSAL